MALNPTRVYIVEDDASVARSLARLMRSVGFEPEVFTSADDFLAAPTYAPNACVIADVQMRGGNGLLLKRRLVDQGSSMPVILLTADDTEATRAEATRAGFAGFLLKPVDDLALIDSIRSAVRRSR